MKVLTWELIRKVLTAINGNALLYGPPGTGKTFLAHWLGKVRNLPVFSVTLSEDMSAQELVGHFIPKGGDFVWHNGPGLLAWERPGILNLNEIDRCSGGVEIALHSLLDDPEISSLTLPDGHTAKPRKGFCCIATMNGEPDELPAPLRDRFAVKIFVSRPDEGALERIKTKVLRESCVSRYANSESGPTYREIYNVDSLISSGLGMKEALHAVFGVSQGDAFYQSVKAKVASEVEKKA